MIKLSRSSVDRDGTIDTGLGSGTFTGSQQDDQTSLVDQKIVGVAHTYSDASESECLSEGTYQSTDPNKGINQNSEFLLKTDTSSNHHLKVESAHLMQTFRECLKG